jgi:hypothetical protein
MLGLPCPLASIIMPVQAPFSPIVPRLYFDAAKRRAESLGIVVVSVCHADIPNGTPLVDGLGNYIKARTVYIGKAGTPEKRCAYARCFSTIHQVVEPGTAEALSSIATHLMYWDTFKDRASYEHCHNTPYKLLPHQQDQLVDSWRDHASTAQRAIACLPAELIGWLRSTYTDS